MDSSRNGNTPANLGKRILSAIVILIILTAFILVRQIGDSTIFLFDILVGFFMIVGTFEVDGILKKMDRPTYTVGLGFYPIICFALLILCVLYNIGFVYYLLMNLGALLLIFIIVFLVGISVKKHTMKQMYLDDFEGSRLKYVAYKSANTMLGCIYPTFLLAFIFLINHFIIFSGQTFSADVGLLGIILLFVTTIFADTCAMLSGRLIKSKKINLKKLGPGKSWSGLIGGILGAILGAFVVYMIFANIGYADLFAEYGVYFWTFLVGGLFCGIFNMSGDIMASYLKRRAGVKDFSDFIPGHGGLMDRINGLVVNSVIVFIFLAIVFLA